MSDAYGNSILFTYTDVEGKKLLQTITDAIGNTIQFSYQQDRIVVQQGEKAYTYVKSTLEGVEVLSQVWDPQGRSTSYIYESKSATYNLCSRCGSPQNPYALITAVVYPTGARTVYGYEVVTREISKTATNQVYRVISGKIATVRRAAMR